MIRRYTVRPLDHTVNGLGPGMAEESSTSVRIARLPCDETSRRRAVKGYFHRPQFLRHGKAEWRIAVGNPSLTPVSFIIPCVGAARYLQLTLAEVGIPDFSRHLAPISPCAFDRTMFIVLIGDTRKHKGKRVAGGARSKPCTRQISHDLIR
ncbi:unnamed protein product [Lasius platythorax]|uniref:Uncharacterized protein n=1 Tax=Lasius platythorax TaxID=488582 RepID=A0AAV2N9G3_9HYME